MRTRSNLKALQAFEAVARLLSVSRAAEELGITQSAVSHQVRILSKEVGEKLLLKDGRGISLTPTGMQIAARLKTAFMDIDRSIAEAIGGSRDTIRLALCSSFAPGWLIPRLESFYSDNPDLDLKLLMCAQDPELTDAVADAFVTVKPVEAGFYSVLICREMLVPVTLASTRRRFGSDLPLITTDLDGGRIGKDWLDFAQLAGLDFAMPAGGRWLFASHYIMALDMARRGLGAALVPDFLVEEDVRSGMLVVLDDNALSTGEDYYLSVKESRRREPMIGSLIRWMRREVAQQKPDTDAKKMFAVVTGSK